MTTYVVAVYLIDRAYGGPEEGGWYFNCGEHVRTLKTFRREDEAVEYSRRLNRLLKKTLNKGRREISSVLSDGRYAAEVWDNHAPSHYPTQRPHYE